MIAPSWMRPNQCFCQRKQLVKWTGTWTTSERMAKQAVQETKLATVDVAQKIRP